MGVAIEGAGDPRSMLISVSYGLCRVRLADGRYAQGATLESALSKLAPDAPPEYVHHTAMVLDGILGIPVVDEP